RLSALWDGAREAGAVRRAYALAPTVNFSRAVLETCVPSLAGRLGRLSALWDGAREAGAVRRAYALAPTVNFSRAVLETCAQPVVVSSVPDLTWCDLGSPDRVLKTLARSGIEVPWLAGATA